MSFHPRWIGRRRFVQAGVTALLALPAVALHPGRTARAAEQLDPASGPAQALNYTPDAAGSPRSADHHRCAVCVHYQGSTGDDDGPCNIFQGKLVNADGWCSAFAEKS